MNLVKTHAINTWKSPKSIKNVQGFLEFAKFYWCFIKDYAKLVSFFIALTRKDRKFHWVPIKEMDFQAIKKTVLNALVLQHFAPYKECTVETDATEYVSGIVFS